MNEIPVQAGAGPYPATQIEHTLRLGVDLYV